jgi:hypothetical protein
MKNIFFLGRVLGPLALTLLLVLAQSAGAAGSSRLQNLAVERDQLIRETQSSAEIISSLLQYQAQLRRGLAQPVGPITLPVTVPGALPVTISDRKTLNENLQKIKVELQSERTLQVLFQDRMRWLDQDIKAELNSLNLEEGRRREFLTKMGAPSYPKIDLNPLQNDLKFINSLRKLLSPYPHANATAWDVGLRRQWQRATGYPEINPYQKFTQIMSNAVNMFNVSRLDPEFLDGLYNLVIEMAQYPSLRVKIEMEEDPVVPLSTEQGMLSYERAVFKGLAQNYSPYLLSREKWMRVDENLFSQFRRIFLRHLSELSYLTNHEAIDPIIEKFVNTDLKSLDSENLANEPSLFIPSKAETAIHLLHIMPAGSALHTALSKRLNGPRLCSEIF